MNLQDTQKSYPSYYAIIPAQVRYCKNLEPSAKLFYGELTALCNMHGYCWASNHYFEELYDVDERTIRRWLESLSSNGFIRIEMDRKNFSQQRKIFINHDFQKIFTEGQNSPTGGTEVSGGSDKKVLQNNTSNNTQKKQQQEPEKPDKPEPKPNAPSAVVVVSLEKLQLEPHHIKDIIKKYDPEDIIWAVEQVLLWDKRESDIKAIYHILNNKKTWSELKSPEKTKETNEDFRKKMEAIDGVIAKNTTIVVGYNYIEFVCGSMEPTRFHVNDKNFINDVNKYLDKLKE